MITYKNIGHFGRLANQMFQFASTVGVARKLGLDPIFPKDNIKIPSVEHFKDGVTREVYFDLPKVFELDDNMLRSSRELSIDYEVQEPHFHFTDLLFKIPDNTNLNGYYQSEKYFEHCKDEIKKLFTFKPEIKVEALTKIPKVVNDIVSIHVRVGDYANLQQFHPVCSSEYYESAMNYFMDNNYYFLVFSDDIDHCKRMFGESENLIYSEGNDPYVDMCMMSMCEHNVIANSSFSWWAAWLNSNPNKRVIAPKKWFGPAYNHSTSDLYCKNWITV
jgi:hypothetical protein